MKKAGGPQRAPHLTAEENGESSVPSRSSMPTTNGSENPSKKNASSGVAPPNLPNDSSRSGPSTARPQSQKASSLPPLQTKLKAEAAQIDIEALKREAREPSSAETSDREDDDADQRTPRGSFRPGISATAHKGRGKGKAQSGNLEEDRSMKKLMDTCFGLRSQWDEQKTQGAEKAKSLYGRERRDVDRKVYIHPPHQRHGDTNMYECRLEPPTLRCKI